MDERHDPDPRKDAPTVGQPRVVISLFETGRGVQPKGLEVDASMFRPHRSFAIGSAVIIVLLTALYTIYW